MDISKSEKQRNISEIQRAQITSVSPVIDACIVIDMFDPKSPRFEEAKLLGDWLIDNHVKSLMPWTGMFEINRTLTRIKNENPGHQVSKYFGEDRPLIIERLPIDANFFAKYFRSDLPYTKAADMLYLSIAYVDKRILITEDKGLQKAAKEAGVTVYSISGFLDYVNNQEK